MMDMGSVSPSMTTLQSLANRLFSSTTVAIGILLFVAFIIQSKFSKSKSNSNSNSTSTAKSNAQINHSATAQNTNITRHKIQANSNHIKDMKKPSVASSKNAPLYRKNDPHTRYDDDGTRYQAIAIPFRLTNNPKQPVEILMITSRRFGDFVFCGGGWERSETGGECALREANEEAGITGKIICELYSDHGYLSEKQNTSRIWFFLMEVTQELQSWDEKKQRERQWMSIDESNGNLNQKRRNKFGKGWTAAMKHFADENLYEPTRITAGPIADLNRELSQSKRITSDDIYHCKQNENGSNLNSTTLGLHTNAISNSN